ncbi:MAG: hypothetical protein JXM79_24570 [Sedimentisphaerales bacterium]|nr:hypothetical protein [Sedimentisphaerales bacterium]
MQPKQQDLPMRNSAGDRTTKPPKEKGIGQSDEQEPLSQNQNTQQGANSVTAELTEKYNELKRIQCLDHTRQELEGWAKRKVWPLSIIIPLIISVVALFGAKSLIREIVDENVKREIERIQRTADNVMTDTIKAGTEARVQATEAAEAAARTKKDAIDLGAQLLALRQDLEREAGHVQGLVSREIDVLKLKLGELEKLVAELARQTTTGDGALNAYSASVKTVETEAQQGQKRFDENARYRVNVYFRDGRQTLANEVSKMLVQAGYKTSTLNIAQAEKLLSPAQHWTVTGSKTSGPALPLLTENTITYTSDVERPKAYEIRDLLSPLTRARELKVNTRDYFAAKYGDPFLAQLSPKELQKVSLIEVYLVQE